MGELREQSVQNTYFVAQSCEIVLVLNRFLIVTHGERRFFIKKIQ